MTGRAGALLVGLALATPGSGGALEWWAGVGQIGVKTRDRAAAIVEAEVRFEPLGFGIFPIVGGLVTSDSSFAARVGFGRRFAIGRRWEAVVTTAACAYDAGDGKELGSAIQFRSALDVAFRWRDDVGVGLSLAHLSNGGLADDNPGVEMLLATVSWRP